MLQTIVKLFGFIFIFSLITVCMADEEDLIAVANWDFVPFQNINKPINIGVVAFHVNGISHVKFSINDGDWVSVSEKILNQDTQVKEYFIRVDPSDYVGSTLTINAIAYPVSGKNKALEPMLLYKERDSDKLSESTAYVSVSGKDSLNNGTRLKPYKSIVFALKNVSDGGEVIIVDPGTYNLDGRVDRENVRQWLTIKGIEGVDKKKIILSMPNRSLVRLNVDRVKFENVSLDFGMIQQIYPENNQNLWFDNVRWFDGNGKSHAYSMDLPPVRTSRYIKGFYVTNAVAEDMTFGFGDALLSRNTMVRNISADAYQNAKTVINASIENIDGRVRPELHSDLFQYFGHFDNLIVYNVSAKKVRTVQNFFFDHVDSTFTNSAFVDVYIDNLISAPLYSQMNSYHHNILFDNVVTNKQEWLFRDDFEGEKMFSGSNVYFRNCKIPRMKRATKGAKGLPDGVKIIVSNDQY